MLAAVAPDTVYILVAGTADIPAEQVCIPEEYTLAAVADTGYSAVAVLAEEVYILVAVVDTGSVPVAVVPAVAAEALAVAGYILAVVVPAVVAVPAVEVYIPLR